MRLFLIVSTASILLFIGFGAMWLRSYFSHDQLTLALGQNSFSMGFPVGRFFVASDSARITNEPRWIYESSSPLTNLDNGFRHWPGAHTTAGFGFLRLDTKTAIWLPNWFGCLVAAILPAVWLRHHYTNGRIERNGICSECGYDLRASPSRCPECGKKVEAIFRATIHPNE